MMRLFAAAGKNQTGQPQQSATRTNCPLRTRFGRQAISCVRIEDLNHAYGAGDLRKQVLFDNDLELARGEIVIMTGPSGSGKTTLLTLIGALRTVQDGSVQVLGAANWPGSTTTRWPRSTCRATSASYFRRIICSSRSRRGKTRFAWPSN